MHENTLIFRAVIPDLNANTRQREKLLRFQAEAAERRRLRRRALVRATWCAVTRHVPLVNCKAVDWRGRTALECGGDR
jgi:hypothetical protein